MTHRLLNCVRCGLFCPDCTEARCPDCPDDGVTAVLDYRLGKCPHFTLTINGRTRKVRLARVAATAGDRRVYFTRRAEKAMDDLEQLDIIVRELRDEAMSAPVHALNCGVHLPDGECTCQPIRRMH